MVLKKLFIIITLLFTWLGAQAQGSMYTRKVKLQDFPVRTTKVVAEGSSILAMRFRDEVAARWRISPFEFCSDEDYERLKSDNSLYFLYIGVNEGVAFMTLRKGGREDDEDNMKKPFEVIKVPIANVEDPSGKELIFMGAFVDIVQMFVEDAMESDNVAYSGLKHYNNRKLTGKRVYVDPEKVDSLYLNEEPNALLGITIAPTNISFKTNCYKMLISADTHELYYYRKEKYKSAKDASFTESEIRQFDKRNGIIPR